MREIVYSPDYMFILSDKAVKRLIELKCQAAIDYLEEWLTWDQKNDDCTWYANPDDLPRHHPLLVQVVKELGADASVEYRTLEIQTIDSDLYIIIESDSGAERIYTPETVNWINANET